MLELLARDPTGSHLDLISDPSAAIRKIYDRAGLAWPARHEERIDAYLRDKPKAKFGKHEYVLADFGLDEDLIRNTYATPTPSALRTTGSNQNPEPSEIRPTSSACA